jgi:2-polyprenyl-3-methyl-5-hydroxy-6-metoxy-1,4-benzoquinol methylase
MSDTTVFYDELSEYYHLIFKDWYQAIEWQGEFFHKLIQSIMPEKISSDIKILDSSCGIGTQCLGLARYHYQITATDISSKSIERAKQESHKLNLDVNFGVADFRSLDTDVEGTFNVVLSADNAVPHLLSDQDLQRSCSNIFSKLEPNGLLIITIRDYDELLLEKPHATTPRIMDSGKRIVFQVWDWQEDGRTYETSHFIMQDVNGNWITNVNKTMYRALQRSELSSFLISAGFSEVTWLMPEQSSYYQPIVVARRSS